MIPYGRQSINDDDIDAVIEVLRSDRLTQGPKVTEFEGETARYCGSKYAVACNSGTAALHLAYEAVGIGEGDEVILPANTFAATANALLYLGAVPVFCDIRMDTYNIDEDKIEALITPKTRAIIPVHFAGHPCEMDSIMAIAKKHNLKVIEDGCHALGARFRGKMIGSIGDATVFSFHPVKSITTGEGGMICTDDSSVMASARLMLTHGITKDSTKYTNNNDGAWYHEMQELGFNYRITDIQCALGVSQLSRLDRFIQRRQEIADFYLSELKDVRGLILPTVEKDIQSAWHLFVIRVEPSRRTEIFQKLHDAGIGAQVHYIPVYRHPYYRKNGFENFSLPNTEEYYGGCISIPIFPDMTEVEMESVVTEIKKILA
jgi:perosamine synthetase